jgi:hypothetical protein
VRASGRLHPLAPELITAASGTEKTNSRDRVLAALAGKEADRVPLDIVGSDATGILIL